MLHYYKITVEKSIMVGWSKRYSPVTGLKGDLKITDFIVMYLGMLPYEFCT